jgi:peptide/nickel transport system permease protein
MLLNAVLRRLLATIPVLLGVGLFVFALLYIIPGDPAALMAGDNATPEDIARIRNALGLDRGFGVRFLEWLGQIAQGDLGRSIFTGVPVTDLIAQRLGPTVSLMVLTLVVAVTVAVPLGVLAAWKQGTWIDRLTMVGAVLGFSVPVFVIGYLLAFVFAVQLGWLPVQGYRPLSEGLWPWLRHLILPSLALGGIYIALIARITRTAMLEVLSQDYVRTAKAKGLTQRAVLFRHALKNAAVPVVTVIGIGIALLIGGAVATETVFSIPGLGRLTVDSILRRDYPVIQGVILFFSAVYLLVNLLVDLSYLALDPRIRY